MANKTSTAESRASATLQRGKACLRCRKRKMRCDGGKPACQQCTRAKKASGCEYDDGKGKTRTQILRETITRLETRIRELEDPEYVPPVITLYDPHHSSSSPSSYGSPGSTSISISHSPFASETASSPNESWTHLPHGAPSPPPPPFTPDIFFDDSEARIQSTFELEPLLIDIFDRHRHQAGLEIHMGHLRESLTLNATEQRHPSLLNAIYLWACFLSRGEPTIAQHEERFLSMALDAHREGLRVGDKVVDLIQASCLLATYFLANGRILEGSYHASASAALVVQCRLQSGITDGALGEAYDLKPLTRDYRDGERILAFWQAYNIDRCWSVALRKPCIIPDGPDTWSSIHCPWPKDIQEYESGHLMGEASFPTIRTFLAGEVSPDGFSSQALRVKASALFATADHLSMTMDDRMKISNNYQDEIHSLELTITEFISSLIPVVQLMDPSMIEQRCSLITSHILAHAAIMHLYQRFSQSDLVAYEKCSSSARACVDIIKQIGDCFFDLDPIVGTCWTSASEILIRELNNIESTWPIMNSTDVRTDLSTLLYAMNNLSAQFPLLALSTSKIQKRLAEI